VGEWRSPNLTPGSKQVKSEQVNTEVWVEQQESVRISINERRWENRTSHVTLANYNSLN